MIRRIFSFVIIAAVISSCGNAGKKEASSAAESTEAVKVQFASLAANPAEYVGKNIVVEGKVIHVCTESGKKLFIVGENPDISLFIQAGENMPKFPMELLGTTVSVEGSIKLKGGGAAMEVSEKHAAKLAEGGAKQMKMGADTCVTEKALAKQSSLADVIMVYKSHSVK